jgi:hypothetical protein
MRKRIIVAAAALAVLIPALVLGAGPASATAAASGAQTITETQPSWAGFTAYPASGDASFAYGSWTVPAISCNNPEGIAYQPRIAVWVGLTGGTTSIHNGTAWLPQIGTDSQCHLGQPQYMLIWEMYTKVPGGGDGPQALATCQPGDYDVCGNLPVSDASGIEAARVHAGDTITASVYFTNSFGSIQRFHVSLFDHNIGKGVSGYLTTNDPVPLGSIERQGGVIVENGPLSPILTMPSMPPFGSFTPNEVVVVGGSGGYSYIRWVMNPTLLGFASVTTAPFVYSATAADAEYTYSVTYARNL